VLFSDVGDEDDESEDDDSEDDETEDDESDDSGGLGFTFDRQSNHTHEIEIAPFVIKLSR
jgi:hypothetical protein